MSTPPRVWKQSRYGRALDLVEPHAEQVNFAEIADQLSLINRYVGASTVAVSVANHTLIAFRAAERAGATERERALVLLHDALETRIGDKATPVKAMEFAVARQMFGLKGEDTLRQVMAEVERRHDAAIYAAAELNPPSEAERAFVKHCDIVALNTERRDFLARPPMPWGADIEAVPALSSRQRLLPPPAASLELHALFLSHLPGARAQSARAAPITQRSA